MAAPPITGRYIEIHLLDSNDVASLFEFRIPPTFNINVAFIKSLFAGLCDGRIVAVVRVDREPLDTDVGPAPTSQLIQRDIRWQIDYIDNVTGTIHHGFIPTADLSLLPSGSEQLPLDSGVGEDFKDAWDAVALSPAGNAVTLQNIEFAG